MHHSESLFLLVLATLIFSTAGCAHVNGDDADTGGDADADADVAPDADDADLEPDADPDEPGDADEPLEDVIIYAHSRDRLYLFSPSQNRVLSELQIALPGGGPAPEMVDLAVNRDGEIYTSSHEALFSIDTETGVATLVDELTDESGQSLSELGVSLYALTFIPTSLFPEAGDDEVLVGAANDGTCYRVDPATAVATYVGEYPAEWRSSGDLVSVEGLETTFATLRVEGYTPEDPDYLAEVSFMPDGTIALSTPKPVQNDDRIFNQLFGLGYWGRQLYGFTAVGELVAINRDTAEGELATTDTGATEFWGAGVTTQVPVLY
jgi:hypothetical protein